MLHGGFLFFNSANVGPSRALAEAGGEIGQLVVRSGGVDFDAAIIEIAGVAGESQAGSGVPGEVAETDALNASANQPAASLRGS